MVIYFACAYCATLGHALTRAEAAHASNRVEAPQAAALVTDVQDAPHTGLPTQT